MDGVVRPGECTVTRRCDNALTGRGCSTEDTCPCPRHPCDPSPHVYTPLLAHAITLHGGEADVCSLDMHEVDIHGKGSLS